MGSSCSSGQKEKESKAKGSKKGKKRGGSPRGSNASNSSAYAYQKVPSEATPPSPTSPRVPAIPVEPSVPVPQQPIVQPQSPVSPPQVGLLSPNRGLPSLLEHFPTGVVPLLSGNTTTAGVPDSKPHKIVLFICAAQEDTGSERSSIVRQVYPKLRRHCAKRGYEVDVSDLHRIPSHHLDTHLLRQRCIHEFYHHKRQAHVVPIVLLNESLGQLLLPLTLSSADREALITSPHGGSDLHGLLERWYKSDPDTQPPSYHLQPTPLNFSTKQNGSLSYTEEQQVLLEHFKAFDQESDKFLATYLEDLVHEVVYSNDEERKHCVWTTRKYFQQTPDAAGEFPWLPQRVTALQTSLLPVVDENHALHFSMARPRPNDAGVEVGQYLEDMCSQLYPLLCKLLDKLIDEDLSRPVFYGHVGVDGYFFQDLAQHMVSCQEQAGRFRGRDDFLLQVRSYLLGPSTAPLIIHGPAGCGKSTIAAKIVQLCSDWNPTAHVVFRFVGLTPASSTTEQVVRSVCEHCCLLAGEHPNQISQPQHNVSKLSKRLGDLVQGASSLRPLYIVIDGLDQVQSYGSLSISWLPTELPPDVKLVLTLRDETPQLQEIKALLSESSEFLSVPDLEALHCTAIAEEALQHHQIILSAEQKEAIKAAVEKVPLPLYAVMLGNDLSMWSSAEVQSTCHDDLFAQINGYFDRLEMTFGLAITKLAFGYMTLAKHGILDTELIDLLLYEEDNSQVAVEDQHEIRCSQRALWSLLRLQMDAFLNTRLTGHLSVTTWKYTSLRMVAEQRYAGVESSQTLTKNLVRYYTEPCAGSPQAEVIDNPVLEQLLKYGCTYNRRKLDELPMQVHRLGKDIVADYLLNGEWLFSKVCGSDVYQVLEDLSLVTPNPDLLLLQQLLETAAQPLAYDGSQLYAQMVARLPSPDPDMFPQMAALHSLASSAPVPSLLPVQATCIHPPTEIGDVPPSSAVYIDSLHCMKNSTTHMVSLSSEQGEIVVWSIYDQCPVRRLTGITEPKEIKLVDEQRALVLCGRELKLYNLDEGIFEVKLKGVMNQKMPFYDLHDNDHVVSLSRNRMYVNMTNLGTGDCVATFKVGEDRFLNSLLVSANGQMCVCGDETQKPFPLLVWDLVNRKLLYDLRIPHHEFLTNLAAITSDGHYVVSVAKEVADPSPNFIIVYDLQSGTLFKKWKPDVNTCSIAITINGSCVVSGCDDSSLLVWDLGTGACRFSLRGHTAPVDKILLDDAGIMCVTYDSTGKDRSVRAWDIVKGKSLAVFTPDVPIHCCQLSPDGHTVVLGLRGRTTILTLVLCKQCSTADMIPEDITFANADNTGLEVDLRNAG